MNIQPGMCITIINGIIRKSNKFLLTFNGNDHTAIAVLMLHQYKCFIQQALGDGEHQ